MIPFLRIRWTTCLGMLFGCVLIQQMGASLGVITAFVNFAVSNSSVAHAATGQITSWTGIHPGAGIYVVTRSVNVAGANDPWVSFGCLRTYPDKVFFGVTYKLDATADAALETSTLQRSISGTILTIGDAAPRVEPGRQDLGATIAEDGRWNFTYVYPMPTSRMPSSRASSASGSRYRAPAACCSRCRWMASASPSWR